MDAIADSKDTMMAILDDVYEDYIVKYKLQWLIVKAAAKVYEILTSVK